MTALHAAADPVPSTEPHLFPVALENIFTHDGIPIPRVKSVVRQDSRDPLSVVSDRYRLITHGQAESRVKPFTDALGVAKITRFLEKNGARLISRYTYADQTVTIPAVGDIVALEVNVINSYDSHLPLKYTLGARVLRCSNGMTVIGGEFEFSWKHTGEEQEIILPDPVKVLAHFKKAGDTWDLWARTELKYEDRLKVMSSIVAMKVLTETQIKKWESNFEQAKTVWTLYDSFTYIITHEFAKLRESSRLHKLSQLQFAFSTLTQSL